MRKHLHFSIDEWVRLPWWQQRLYVDQLNDDFAREAGEEPDPEPDQIVTTPGALAGLGLNVQQGPAPHDE